MGKYSRTAKYQELREHLQNDAEGQIDSKDLSQFTERLSKIDNVNLGTRPSHEPLLKQNEYLDSHDAISEKEEIATFNNEYLDEYIQEVKQYNKDKGRMLNDDTQINILKELRGDKPKASLEEVASYPTQDSFASRFTEVSEETTDIPFLQQDTKMNTQISMELSKMLNEEDYPSTEYDSDKYVAVDDEDDDDYTQVSLPFNLEEKFNREKSERERLMEETSKMKVQLDHYRGNLDQMEERVNNSNRILNFILVILILALLVVIGVVGYWLLLSRGII
ncbi:hypothetical protein [Anaerorhabdus furcosa]|uniref:Uncharacterized protein n=1 Tax=Anaerorhabdus furcosa TaxID=118967 RepID=A0A1T4P8K2_9FIRM|nr:hypothetical protein [Anaerorhabdus furcosa]SJZ87731.1 hypothetical protein SAMN02745191_1928 [Anaerorhabdus furcosa]